MREFPGAGALAEFRGRPALDHEAVVELLMALAGPDGLATRLGDELVELECNPVLVTPTGAIALDARLILRTAPAATEPPPPTDFTRLFAPRAIAVAGASATRSGFGNRALAAYRAFGWSDGLYALHPDAEEVDGVRAVADLSEIEAPIDYLLVAVPAPRCADVVRATAGRVPFVHVISGGFDEVGADGAALSDELLGGRARGEDPRARPELHRCVQPRRAASLPTERAAAKRATSASSRRAAASPATSSPAAPAGESGTRRSSASATPSTSRRPKCSSGWSTIPTPA